MTLFKIYSWILWLSFPLAVIIFITLLFIPAPYGRHKRGGWGINLPNWLGWFIMESPSAIVFLLLFWYEGTSITRPMLFFFVMWETHYLHRSLIYPFHIAGTKKAMPISVVIMAIIFNLGNAYINGGNIYLFSDGYSEAWLFSPQMITGTSLFIGGFIINKWADKVLRNLRYNGEEDYQIPYGGLYRWISCPNYFGEIIEWIGWAVATWSFAGLAFAVWTFANLAPRAHANHKWYHNQFPDYPKKRKAFIPGVW